MRALMFSIGFALGMLSASKCYANDIWVSFGGLSIHTTPGFQGFNPALIADVRWQSESLGPLNNHGVAAGAYLNSVSRLSAIGCYHNRPWSTVRGEWGRLQVGAMACLVNGYPKFRGGEWFPVAVPLVAWQPSPNVELVPVVLRGAEKDDGWVFGMTFAARFK